MIRFLIPMTAMLAMPVLAQTNYASATYLKAKPGMQEELATMEREIADRGGAAVVSSGERTGYVRLGRVFPSSHEVGHDVVYFYTRTSPPNLGEPGPDVFLKAIGMTRAEWTAKARSSSDVVKMEVWQSMYSHGSIAKGDTVRMGLSSPPAGKTADYMSYVNEYEGAMRARMVEKGLAKSMQSWRLRLTPGSAPYNFVNLEAYAKGDGPLQAWPNRPELFLAVHPGKDYHKYLTLSEQTVRSVGTVVYRVDAAIWK